MTDTKFCVLCASGEHSSDIHNFRETTLFVKTLGDDETSISVVEHYWIIDENLPYDERFGLAGYTLEIQNRDELVASVTIGRSDALQLAKDFLGFGMRAQ